ncbi:right-handed parallel beta-helix repeat-containing protein [Roseibacillus persicicus]|uniref:choice-of-anchor Q domain-containing protein n=1 Tax=Roseibacillus persicicus TaxID=454148 RepID=UPI00398B7DDA
MNNRNLILSVILISCSNLMGQVLGTDSFGYEMSRMGSATWVDITEFGEEVISSGNETSSNAAPPEGIGEPVTLEHPFFFYGETVREMVPTVNGYLSTNLSESGSDDTPDCTLPTPVSSAGSRIYVAHRDWILNPAPNARVLYQYFPESPHPHAECGVNVFSWEGAIPAQGSISQSFQALLFNNGDLILTIAPFATGFGSSEMLGIQNDDGTVGIGLNCNSPLTETGRQSFLFQAPTHFSNNTESALLSAIAGAVAGERIELKTAQIDLSSPLHITKPLTIAGTPTDNIDPVLRRGLMLDGQKVVIDGVHVNFIDFRSSDSPDSAIELINGGSASFYGSTLLNAEESLISAGNNSDIWLSNCSLESVRFGSSHLIKMLGADSLMIDRSVLSDSRGAAVSMVGSSSGTTLQVRSSSIFRNRGPAFKLAGVEARITNSTISSNVARGIEVVDSQLDLHHCTIADHGSTALLVEESAVTLSHNIFARNQGTDSDANLVVDQDSSYTSEGANLIDSPFAGPNQASDLINTAARISPLGAYGSPNVGARRSDLRMPLLCHMPFYDSPAIGGGIDTDALKTKKDQRGKARTFSATGSATEGVDIGSVEASRIVYVTTAADQLDTPPGAQVSLREALLEGDHIVIDPTLSGSTLTLSNNAATLPTNNLSFIDGSGLSNPFTVSGGGTRTQPLFSSDLHAHNLTFRDSKGSVLRGRFVSLSNCLVKGISYQDTNTVVGSGTSGFIRYRERDGGAFYVENFGIFTDCVFEDNRVIAPLVERANEGFAARGGAICAAYASESVAFLGIKVPRGLYLLGCRFEGNQNQLSAEEATPTQGAGAVESLAMKTIVEDCVFTGNAGTTGALSVSAGDLLEAALGGGAVLNVKGDRFAEVSRSSFDKNQVGSTGGASVTAGALLLGASSNNAAVIESCYLGSNECNTEATADNGYTAGAAFVAGNVVVNHCTFQDNEAVDTGTRPQVVSSGALVTNGPVQMLNSLLARNVVSTEGNQEINLSLNVVNTEFISLGNNLSTAPSVYLDHPSDLTGLSAELAPSYRDSSGKIVTVPFSNSPILDAANSMARPPLDLHGGLRLQDLQPDIGATESTFSVTVTTLQDEISNNGTTSLREAFALVHDQGRIRFDPALNSPSSEPIILLEDSYGPLVIDKSLYLDGLTFDTAPIIVSGPKEGVFEIIGSNTVANLTGIHISGTDSLSDVSPITLTDGAHLSLSRSLVAGFLLQKTPALSVTDSSLALENVTITEVFSTQTSSVIEADNSLVELSFVSIAHNTCEDGGTIYLDDSLLTSSTSVLSQNLFTTGSDIVGPSANQLELKNSTGFESEFNQNLDTLRFTGGHLPVLPPLPGSQIVNAVAGLSTAELPVTDSRGLARRYGVGVDLGAFELGSFLPGRVPPFDQDNDSMDDFWEDFYRLDPTEPTDAGENPDMDAFTNVQEYRFETNPFGFDQGDGSVFLSILSRDDNQLIVLVETSGARPFQLFQSLSLASEDWVLLLDGSTGVDGRANVTLGNTQLLSTETLFLRAEIAN